MVFIHQASSLLYEVEDMRQVMYLQHIWDNNGRWYSSSLYR